MCFANPKYQKDQIEIFSHFGSEASAFYHMWHISFVQNQTVVVQIFVVNIWRCQIYRYDCLSQFTPSYSEKREAEFIEKWQTLSNDQLLKRKINVFLVLGLYLCDCVFYNVCGVCVFKACLCLSFSNGTTLIFWNVLRNFRFCP